MKDKDIGKVELMNSKIDFAFKMHQEEFIRPNQAFVTFMNKKDRDFAIKC